jgi:glycosyltransferase involved in cell wall biosynthesis
VHRFIALTEFARQKFVSAGFEPQRVVVKPNFVVPDGSIEYKGRRSGGIFVGRLSREKGLDVLAEAVRAAGIAAIDVVGTGPELNKLQQHSTLRLLGWKSQGVVRDLIRRASYLVLPSICYESFGRAVLEAYSAGVPVIASRLGALPELVEEGETGLLFSPGSATDLASRLAWAEQNPHEMRRMGESARHCYRRLYTPEKNYERLRSIYEEAIRDAQQKGGGSDARASRFC